MYLGMNYIHGFCATRADFSSLNPATEEVIGQFPQSTEIEINSAIEIAHKQFKSWKNLSRVQRAEYFWKLAKIIEENIENLTNAISLETGKSLNESKAEVVEALHMVQLCFGKAREQNGEILSSELPERDSFTIRKPKGVVAVITPWNFPFAITFWCAGPALLEGNTVVFKPSELTPMVGQITMELIQEAGFPPGVFSLLHGDGMVGSTIVHNDLIKHVAFTGSAEVGRLIRMACAESWDKTCSCEMGSKSAVMVFEDADLKLAVPACANSSFKLSGQRCVSAGRILVQRSILEKFKKDYLEYVDSIGVIDPFTKENYYACSLTYGPLISKEQMDRVETYNDMVRNDSDARILRDSKSNQTKGYFLNPFVYQVEWSDKPYLKQEVFGPSVSIIPFDNINNAIDIYNDTIYGLSLGCITNDFRKMRIIRDNCDSGMIYFNLGSIGAECHLPFGGVKASGNGWSSAAGMFEAVVNKIAVSTNYSELLNFPQGLK